LFKKLLSFNEAKQILEKTVSVKPIGIEKVSLSNAHNRVLAQDIVSPINIPPFTRSTVDGYAVKAANTFGASEDKPIRFKLCGHVSIGEAPKVTIKDGLVAEIVTGAPLPRGANSVVMVEYTNQLEDSIYVHRPVAIGENVMAEGSDIHKSENVLKKGLVLGSREIGALAAIGLIETTVYRRPRVAVLSTGEEVTEPGEPLPEGKIYDINAYTLSAAVQETGGEPINLGIIPDNKDLLTKVLIQALDSNDVIITSGGVSVGPKDFTPQIVHSLGKPGVIISGVAVKPGKPLTISVIDGKPVFSLPGNPTSALFMFNVFVRPILIKLAGRPEQEVPKVKALVSQKLFPARGRRTFIMVKLSCDQSGRLIASPVPTGLSGAITTLTNADGFIEITEQQQFLEAGAEIDVCLFGKIRKLE